MITIKKSALMLSVAMICALGETTIRQPKNISSAIASTPSTTTPLAQLSNETEGEIENEVEAESATEVQNTETNEAEANEAINPQPASREQIEELLAITGADTTQLIVEQMIGQFRTLAPEVPSEWWDGFMEKALATDFDALLFPIYERNYTAAEVDGLIEFYQSPLGQSLLEKAPIIAQESLAVGQAWGLEIAQELIEELEADGFDLPTSVSIPEEASGEPSEVTPETESEVPQ